MTPLLDVTGLCAGYLGEDVVHDITLSVAPGEAVGILVDATAGTVRFAGDDITEAKAHAVVRSGLVYVPAERHLFPQMSVQENLFLGAYPNRPDSTQLDLVYGTFPRLKERQRQRAGTLSGGEQQMLAVGRALMSGPSLLILDEPTTGLSPLLAQEAYAALANLRADGLTVLVAEQQVPLAPAWEQYSSTGSFWDCSSAFSALASRSSTGSAAS